MSNPRQLIVCCDGTNNNVTGGRTDTNVIKLQSGLARDAGQIVFYDPGVGNPGELPGATWADSIRAKFQRLSGLAFGSGVYENIAECYTFLMLNYEKGDEIYLFGFSRGSFTARALSGVVNMFGLLRPELTNMVPTLLYIYFSKRESNKQKEDVSTEVADIKRLFVDPDSRDVWIHYIGVWDTVASIGMPPFDKKITGSPTIKGKKFHHVRQALALDEYRKPFVPRLYSEQDFDDPADEVNPAQSLKQRWFHGAHCDVGGGYDPAPDGPQSGCGLSDVTLHWLYDEARTKGLRGSPLVLQPTITRVHSELYNESLWALAGMVERSRLPDREGPDAKSKVPPPVVGEAVSPPHPISFPGDTVWAISRPVGPLIVAVVVWAIAMIVLAQLLVPTSSAAAPHLSAWTDAVRNLICWQSTPQWTAADKMSADIPHLRTALLFQLVAQGAGLFILARWSSWAFAQVARLRDPQLPPSAALNKLGVAPRWFTVFTLGTTIAAWISLLTGPWSWPWLAVMFRFAMNAFWWLQLVALLGIAALVGWGIWGRLRR
jgi:hypothetical protein